MTDKEKPVVFQGKKDKEPRIIPGGSGTKGGARRPYPKKALEEALDEAKKSKR